MISDENRKKAERIANAARNSISAFCIEECNSYCCRKGYLILKPNQVNKVTQGKKKELIEKGILKQLDSGNFSLYMSRYDSPCPSFKDAKCSIHTSKLRPQTCGDFPLYLKDDLIFLSPRCLAVKQNLFYPFVKKLIALGYKPCKVNPFADVELYRMEFEELK